MQKLAIFAVVAGTLFAGLASDASAASGRVSDGYEQASSVYNTRYVAWAANAFARAD